MHPDDVLGRGLVANQNHRAALGHLGGAIRGQGDPSGRGSRAGGEPAAEQAAICDHAILVGRVEDWRQQLRELLAGDPGQRLLLGNAPFGDHIDRDPRGGDAGALAGAGLQHEELAPLDGELDVLHLAQMVFELAAHPHQLGVRFGELAAETGMAVGGGDRDGRPDAGDHVLPLSVGQVLTVDLVDAGRRVAGERDAGGTVGAIVAEDHDLHVDARARILGQPMQPPIVAGALVLPALEDGLDRAV